ncbi:MAG: D-ribose transporter binding protein [Conexibacter sp.]|nr:D-ribose transporter binding protein [Conexibacter sp.]
MSVVDDNNALVLEDVSKVFQGQPALRGVDLTLRSGEVHALLGHNGSGKSTLIKILAGYHQPEPGARATLHGKPLSLGSAEAAHAAGITFVHQDLGVIDELDAVDNLALGARYQGRWWLSDRRERRAARERLAEYGVDLDVSTPLRDLSPARRTIVAVVRALQHGVGRGSVLVLDESTAALPAAEVSHLFELVREVRRQGGTILYVTHRLSEVFEIADRVSVLRDGRRVATRDVASLTHDGLVELIVGRSLSAFYPDPPAHGGDVVLEALDIRAPGLDAVTLRVCGGEIVGVAGLVGSGHEQLLATIFGGRERSSGTVAVGTDVVRPGDPRAAIEAGVAYASADRRRLGATATWTLRENVTLPAIPSRGPARWLAPRAERADVVPWLERLDVQPASPEHLFADLSGGNQQKVVLARWLRRGARVFLLDEPTAGIDVASKRAVYEALSTLAASGAGIVLSSSDAEELCAVCDRVLVLRDGRVAGELAGDELTTERLLTMSMRAGDGVPTPVGA